MIQVENLTKLFGPVVALSDVTFRVEKGEIVGFLGPNGAGKTTTMRILTTWLPATSGLVRVAGFDVRTQSMDVRRNIGYLPESVPLYSEMRVEEYLAYRARLKGVDRSLRRQRVESCLVRCRIRDVRRRLIGTLSKGYRQRVGLADAMVHDPAILILDEPTAGLDPLQIRETLAAIKDLGTTHTILLSTHHLAEVETICERVIIINQGHVGFNRKLGELEADPVIVIEVRGPAEQVANVLRTTDGVEQVTPQRAGDGVAAFEVRCVNHQDLREALSQRLSRNGWPIRRLDLLRRKLEDRYMEVLRLEDPLQRAIKPGERPAEPTAVTTRI